MFCTVTMYRFWGRLVSVEQATKIALAWIENDEPVEKLGSVLERVEFFPAMCLRQIKH